MPKKDIKDSKPSSLDNRVNVELTEQIMSSNVVDIKNTKKLVKDAFPNLIVR